MRGLAHFYLRKILPQFQQKRIKTLALKQFDQKSAIRCQPVDGERQRKFRQVNRCRLIYGRHPTKIGGHIRYNKIEFPIFQCRFELVEDGFVTKVSLDEQNLVDFFHRQNIERHHPALAAQPSHHVLRPTARRRSQVDHGHPRPQQLLALIDLGKFERRAGAPALLLGQFDIRVVEMALHPATASPFRHHLPSAGCGAIIAA